jgi:small GTP-binding protein
MENNENKENIKTEEIIQIEEASPSTNNSDIKTSSTSQRNSKISIIKKSLQTSNYHYDYLFKISLIGDSGIGKTAILIRFVEECFKSDTSSTIGVDFKIVSVKLENDVYAKMQIWDTCGSERFKALTSSFIKTCQVFILVFDLTKHKTFKNIENWLSLINDNTEPQLLCLVGNKCDLEEERQVTREDALRFAQRHSLKYIETSAKTNEKIEEVFIYIAECLYKEIIKRKGTMSPALSIKGFEIGGSKYIQDKKEENPQPDDSTSCRC